MVWSSGFIDYSTGLGLRISLGLGFCLWFGVQDLQIIVLVWGLELV